MIWWFLCSCALLLVLVYGIARFKVQLYCRKYPPLGQFARIDGITLHYYDTACAENDPSGHSTPLVFIHGASSNLRDAVFAFEDGLKEHRRLIFVDRPGFGYSNRSSSLQSDPRQQADLIAQFLLGLRVDRAIVIGHSWGAAVAAAMGLRHADLMDGLVFLAPATHPWAGGVLWYYRVASWPVFGRLFGWLVAAIVSRRRITCAASAVFAPDQMPEGYPDKVAAELSLRPSQFLANAADIVGLNQNVREMSVDYSAIETQSLIITGNRDSVVLPNLHAHGLMRDLPNARIVEFEDCGHMPHHSRRNETIAEIERFANVASH